MFWSFKFEPPFLWLGTRSPFIGYSITRMKLCIAGISNVDDFIKMLYCTVTVDRTLSYKKDDEPLLNLTGARSRCSREKVLICTDKRELESPLLIQEV
jgi:hypothetical protein